MKNQRKEGKLSSPEVIKQVRKIKKTSAATNNPQNIFSRERKAEALATASPVSSREEHGQIWRC